MSHLLRKKGSVLVFSLIVLSIVLSTALSITAVNVSNRKSAASTAQSVQSFQTADTATEKVMKAIYNGNYLTLTDLYAALQTSASTCPGVLNLTVAGGTAQIKFSDTSGASLVETDCTSALWRDRVARVKVEGSGSASGGATRVIEVGIAPLSSMAWGANASGQLGDGTTTDKYTPVATVGGSKWKSVSAGGSNAAGGSYVIAVRADGTLWAWGLNNNGQLGDGTITSRTSPIQIGTDNNWDSVSAGGFHSLAIRTDHSMWAWGGDIYYQLGDNATNNVLTPLQIGTGNNCSPSPCPAEWKVVSAGNDFSLAIDMDDELWSWGRTDNGRLGLGASPTGHQPEKVTSCSPSCPGSWKDISAGGNHALAIGVNGSDDNLYAWGLNTGGQLGDGTITSRTSPIQIGNDAWASIGAGNNHSLGIKKNGTLWAWGQNNRGQVGNDSSNPVLSEVQLGSDNTWKSVSGSSHSLALKTDGTLYAWGYNSNGQLGNGDRINQPSYQTVVVDGKWQSISASETLSIGVRQ